MNIFIVIRWESLSVRFRLVWKKIQFYSRKDVIDGFHNDHHHRYKRANNKIANITYTSVSDQQLMSQLNVFTQRLQ